MHNLHVKFENFLGAVHPDSQTGEGLRRPSPDVTPSALRASLGAFGRASGPSAPLSSLERVKPPNIEA